MVDVSWFIIFPIRNVLMFTFAIYFPLAMHNSSCCLMVWKSFHLLRKKNNWWDTWDVKIAWLIWNPASALPSRPFFRRTKERALGNTRHAASLTLQKPQQPGKGIHSRSDVSAGTASRTSAHSLTRRSCDIQTSAVVIFQQPLSGLCRESH